MSRARIPALGACHRQHKFAPWAGGAKGNYPRASLVQRQCGGRWPVERRGVRASGVRCGRAVASRTGGARAVPRTIPGFTRRTRSPTPTSPPNAVGRRSALMALGAGAAAFGVPTLARAQADSDTGVRADAAGRGRTGVTDSDSGPNADRAGHGRSRPDRVYRQRRGRYADAAGNGRCHPQCSDSDAGASPIRPVAAGAAEARAGLAALADERFTDGSPLGICVVQTGARGSRSARRSTRGPQALRAVRADRVDVEVVGAPVLDAHVADAVDVELVGVERERADQLRADGGELVARRRRRRRGRGRSARRRCRSGRRARRPVRRDARAGRELEGDRPAGADDRVSAGPAGRARGRRP